jgi:hypothetical protein
VAYLKPNGFVTSVANRLAMKLGAFGVMTLVVPRRTTGETQEIPVIPVERGGGRYVVSTRGESEWVRNLRRSGRAQLRDRKGNVTPVSAVEVAVDERPPIIEAYRKKAGREVNGYFKKLPDPADHPIFRLDADAA